MKKNKANQQTKHDAQHDFDRIKNKSQKVQHEKDKPHMPSDGFDLIMLPYT